MSEEQVESIFQHACEGAAESIGSTRVDWQSVVDAIRFLRAQVAALESRLREAGEQKPVPRTSEYHFAMCGAHLSHNSDAYFAARSQTLDGGRNRHMFQAGFIRGFDAGEKVYASAPVPAHPAVPEAVMRALDRMCTPLDDSWLGSKSATAQSDAHNMKVIRDYVLGSAVKESLTTDRPAVPEAVANDVIYSVSILRKHNEWRRCNRTENWEPMPYSPAQLGGAIACVCDHIEHSLGMGTVILADVFNNSARYQWLKTRSQFGNRVPHIEQYPYQRSIDKVEFPHFTIVGLDAAIDAAILSATDTEVKNG